MSVAFDAKTAAWTQNSGNTIAVTNLTVGSGSNRGLAIPIIAGALSAWPPPGLTITRDTGESLAGGTIVLVPNSSWGDSSLTGAGAIYALLNPTAGNHTINIGWTTAGEMFACAISFTGVDQTNVATAFPGGNSAHFPSGTAGPVAVTITSATGDMVIGAETQNTGPFLVVSGTTLAPESDAGNLGCVSNYDNGASSVVMSATFSGTSAWGAMGSSVKSASGGGGGGNVPYNPWPQIAPMVAQKHRMVGWSPNFDPRRRFRKPNRLILPARALLVPPRKLLRA